MNKKQKQKPESIAVTQHAIDKYLLVTGCQNKDDAEARIKKMFRRAKEVSLPKQYKLQRLLHNRVTQARYFEFDKFRMVIVDDTMVTFEERYL